jgi:UDP-galactopyranose mutase
MSIVSCPIPTEVDYLVVGSGLTGGVIARSLADAGQQVHVVERRSHLGGNVHDQVHSSGIRFHTYGPHYFRTSSLDLWNFVRRFSPFYSFEAKLQTWVEGRFENWPVSEEFVRQRCGDDWKPGFCGTPTNFEEASLAKMPAEVYRLFVQGYTEKQWGVPARQLSAELASRFQLGRADDPRLMKHTYQGLPSLGYATFMVHLLEGIPTTLGCDFLRQRDLCRVKKRLIYTGPIDEFFDCDLGRLDYRGQRREHAYYPEVDWVQSVCQVNCPDPVDGAHIRVLEWKHMMPPGSSVVGTLTTRETPWSPDHSDAFEYPFPDGLNQALYRRYRERAEQAGVLICGRLGEYRYYDMDQAIARAQMLSKRLLEES